MQTFDFTVKIEAEKNEEARDILVAMFDIMKTVRKETSTREFIQFASVIKDKPWLVKKAKLFL